MQAKKHIATALLLIALLGTANAATSAEQYGITWTFDRDYETGQFANGDYWVVGPLTIIDINPASGDDGTGRIVNGSMINPSPTSGRTEGYDSELYGIYHVPGDYDPGLNAARPNGQALSASNPLTVQPGSSLASAISTPGTDGRAKLQTAAILTVLDSPAPEGSFRPPYVNVPKDIEFNKNQLDYSLLQQLTPVGNVPRLHQQLNDGQTDSVERMFERPWLDHVPGWPGRSHHPLENMHSYDRDICTQEGIAALMLHLNYANAEKETLLIRFTQLGIDNYGVIQDGGRANWVQDSGRKFPILFAGLMLNDADMKNIEVIDDPADPDYVWFEEDSMMFYVSQADVEITHSAAWNPDYRDTVLLPYEQEDIGLPEWTKNHITAPEQANKWWDTTYRQVISPSWDGFTLAVHIMNAKDLWNRNGFFDYVDRHVEIEGPGTDFAGNMWNTYRADYGCVWTRDNHSDEYSQGHYDCNGQDVYCTGPSAATSCSQYPNQTACDYDPCNLGCGGACQADSCSNSIKDGDERGVDCGGSCGNSCTFYLDAETGSDSGDGTSASPWQTLAKAQENALPGDTVILRSGNYGSFVDSTSNRTDWVKYEADAGHEPVFTSIQLGEHTGPYDLYLHFEGIKVTPGYLHPTHGYYRTASVRTANHVKFVDMVFEGPGYSDYDDSAAVYLQEANDITVDACIIYGGGETYRSAFEYGVYSRYSHDVIVKDCDITGSRYAISAWGRNWTITGNHLHDLDSDGIIAVGISNSLIANNHIHDVRIPPGSAAHTDGIQFYYTETGSAHLPDNPQHVYTEDVTVSSNTIYNIGRQGIFMNFGNYGGDPPDAQRITIENNLVYNCDREGLGAYTFVSYNNANQVFRNNTMTGSVNWRRGSEVDTISGNLLELGNVWDTEQVSEPSHHNYNIVWDWWGIEKGQDSIETRFDWDDSSEKLLWKALFVDYSNNNYRLAPESNAIDYVPLEGTYQATSADLEGNPRLDIQGLGNDDANYADAGAYEFQGTTCIDTPALLNHISQWKQGQMTMLALMEKISLWKSGADC